MPAARLALGSRFDAGDTPACSTLRRFADRHKDLKLAAARAPDAIVAGLPADQLPSGWKAWKWYPGGATASRSGTVETTFDLPHGGGWQVWVGGAVLGQLSVRIDDKQVATMRHRLNRPREYEPVGRVSLDAGRHRLSFDYEERLLAGINDRYLMGPVALSRVGSPPKPTVLPAREVNSLCGEHLDWLEAIQKM